MAVFSRIDQNVAKTQWWHNAYLATTLLFFLTTCLFAGLFGSYYYAWQEEAVCRKAQAATEAPPPTALIMCPPPPPPCSECLSNVQNLQNPTTAFANGACPVPFDKFTTASHALSRCGYHSFRKSTNGPLACLKNLNDSILLTDDSEQLKLYRTNSSLQVVAIVEAFLGSYIPKGATNWPVLLLVLAWVYDMIEPKYPHPAACESDIQMAITQHAKVYKWQSTVGTAVGTGNGTGTANFMWLQRRYGEVFSGYPDKPGNTIPTQLYTPTDQDIRKWLQNELSGTASKWSSTRATFSYIIASSSLFNIRMVWWNIQRSRNIDKNSTANNVQLCGFFWQGPNITACNGYPSLTSGQEICLNSNYNSQDAWFAYLTTLTTSQDDYMDSAQATNATQAIYSIFYCGTKDIDGNSITSANELINFAAGQLSKASDLEDVYSFHPFRTFPSVKRDVLAI